MHETVICSRIQKDAEALSEGKKITAIKIEVGELGPLPPEELKSHLITLTNWKVDMKVKKAKADCDCGFKGRPDIMVRGHDYCLYMCPKCGKAPKLSVGADIVIKEVTV
jgi:Zn finger protein HypA/HybF involved in hydrogenase expression